MRLIPATDFNDFYERARFELTWKINLFLCFVLPLLALSLFWFDQFAYIPTLVGWGATLVILLIMKLTGKYKTSSILFAVLGAVLCVLTLIGIPESYHLIDTLWMMIITLYAYFTLGKIWGNLILIINLAGLISFILSLLNYSLSIVPVLSNGELISLSINAGICALIIAFLIHQFLKTTRFAEEKYISLTSVLQEKNKEVELQNEEKTVMLREIHHRVKNNLQVISSLLRLQARETKDPTALELFKDSTNRVVAMALIHDKMYQTRDLAKINLEEYLQTLLNDLIQSYAVEVPIQADIKSDVETVSNKSLVPLALLFNELVSNSLKHAFHELTEGKIKILVSKENNCIILNYWDNGIWREKQKPNSFGLELIESLTEQMDGTYTRNIKQGTSYEFTLPDNL